MSIPRILAAACLAALCAAGTASAQFDNLGGGLQENPVSVKAWFTPPANGKSVLQIEADIKEGWHIYSLTQPSGGPLATKISVTESGDFKLAGPFRPEPGPKVHFDDAVFKINLEEHDGRVVWSAPIELAAGTDGAALKISGKVNAQACNADTCLPPTGLAFTAALDSSKTAPAAPVARGGSGTYKHENSHTTIRGYVEPDTVTPGGTVKLVLTADPAPGYNAYAYAASPKKELGPKPTLIALTQAPGGWQAGSPQADSQPVGHEGSLHHEGAVSWTVNIQVPQDAQPGFYPLAGSIGYMACLYKDGEATSCDQPRAAAFSVDLKVGSADEAGQVPLAFEASKYGLVEQALGGTKGGSGGNTEPPQVAASDFGWERFSRKDLDKLTGFDPAKFVPQKDPGGLIPLLLGLGTAFLGGLILNVMPCVLPVIGLKIMSFVQQAGESRGRIFALNAWFSAGLIVVFLALATLAAFAGLGWGAQFQSAAFSIVLTCVVFVFALALLGVWEVPIPGFVGSSKANQLAAKEGAGGAFAKGILTTVLATPCTGPFLVPALAWAVKQHPAVVYATFFSVGLGMASPYLLIGAFPKLIGLLPKPGEWMDTFKQLMGFLLLGTVIWLMSSMRPTNVVPTVALLFGLWLACWRIGKISVIAETRQKVTGWATAVLIAGAAIAASFGWLNGVMEDRFGTDFSGGNLVVREHPPGDYTVFVDFTAHW